MPNTYKRKSSNNPEAEQKEKTKTTSTTRVQLLGQAYIGLGPHAKQKVFYNLSSQGSLEYDVLPSLNGQTPRLKITQTGHTLIYTTDYYYTNIPSKLLVIIQPTENKDMSSQQGAAATQFTFAEDQLEEGESHISAEELHRQNIPQLDLRNRNITSLEELRAAFESLNVCQCKEEHQKKSHGRENSK